MITITRITEAEDSAFLCLTGLYQKAFPEEERRDIAQLKTLLQTEPSMYFNAVRCDGKLAGLLVYWDFRSFYYLEHLAVFAEMRNQKIGQKILDWIRKQLRGICILEAEPAETGIATRRINYYRRNGYLILDKTYRQPSYRRNDGEVPLWIMGNQPEASGTLKQQIQIIKEKVYYRND